MNRRLSKQAFSLLHVDAVQLNKKWNYKNVKSPYYRIYYIEEGEGYISDVRETVKLEAGFLYIIPCFTMCHLKCPGNLSQYFIHFFEDAPDGISLFHHNRNVMKVMASEIDIANFKRILDINPGRGINRSDNPKVYEKSAYYQEYQELNNRQTDAVFLETQGILLQLVSRFLNSGSYQQKNTNIIPSKILDAISYIQLHLDKDLTVSQLAKRANQHQDYFSRLFLQSTGERPLAYIHGKRIEKAQYLMITTDLSFTAIAEETGFDNLPYFARIFKKVTSLTPGQYRKQNQSFIFQ
jgi:AraC-like DNA-binding protein